MRPGQPLFRNRVASMPEMPEQCCASGAGLSVTPPLHTIRLKGLLTNYHGAAKRIINQFATV
jgi:hypothetical protein